MLRTENSRIALALLAANYYGHPAEKMKLIGVTGTKGKTTTTYLLKAILENDGHKAGLIGSIGALIGNESIHTINTTPESYEIQKLFHQMVEAGCEYVVMEVSSQGLMLHRTAGFTFDVGIFLNISRDHISPWEHQSLDEYLHCKSLLFRQCRLSILNRDDEKTDRILEEGFAPLRGANLWLLQGSQYPRYRLRNRKSAGLYGPFTLQRPVSMPFP